MVWAEIYFSGTAWLWPGLLLFVLGVALLFWTYRQPGLSPGLKAACMTLKLLGLLALVLCLLEPTWVGQRAKPGANFFVVLADNSQSLQLADATLSRGEQMKGQLRGERSGWQKVLEENFQLRRYLFDSRLQSTRDYDNLDFQGRATAMRFALKTLEERYQGRPLAGILMFTDGNATDLGEDTLDLSGLPPIYPVVLGKPAQTRDISIEKIAVTQTAFEDAPVTLQLTLKALEAGGETLVAQLWPVPAPEFNAEASPPPLRDPHATPLIEQRLRAGQREEPLSARFQFRPASPGLSFYQVRVVLESERDNPDGVTTEATLANNSHLVVVDRGEGPYRILYVGGRPNWEFKFLNRAISEDEEVQLIGLIRLALREPKFEFKGRRGEESNPLFRGFDRKTEETERYDQPVLIRFNTRDDLELQSGFPKTPEDLFPYHAIVLDDLESGFFTHDQRLLLHRYVSERGGALLMLGGPNSLQDGDHARTPVGDMLPVYLDTPMPSAHPGPLTFNLTREGWLQPWTRLRRTESEERARQDQMPPFQVLHPIRNIKPGASVMATASDNHGNVMPALAMQRFGRGRVATMLVGDLWRWGMKNEETQKDMAQAWRQMLRQLVVDVPPFVTLRAKDQADSALQAVHLEVEPRDKAFRPVENAQVTLKIATAPPAWPTVDAGAGAVPSTNAPQTTLTMPAEAALNSIGLYESSFVPRETGAYLAETIVLDDAGVEVGRARAGWTANPAAREFASLPPNQSLLERIALQTEGRLVDAGELEAFAQSLPFETAPVTESWSLPLWHKTAVLLFTLACFTGEWGLRRWRGLA